MSVDVLIVNYRAYAELDHALHTLAQFVGPGDEVVVVDQVSDAAALDRVAKNHPRVRMVARPDNLGFAAAVNLAARASTSPYLLLLNPDSVVEEPVVRTLERWLSAHPDVGVVGPRILNLDGSVQASARRFPGVTAGIAGRSTWLTRRFPNNRLSRHNLLAREAAGTIDVDWVAGSCLMTPRAVFERVGGFDDGFFLYWEDADYCRRVTSLGLRCTYLPDVRVRHLGGRSSAQNPAPAIRAFHRSAYRLYWKHSGKLGRLAAPLVQVALWGRGAWLARRAERREPR